MTDDAPEPQRPEPRDLYRKLVLLTGIRLLVGTALLIATAALSGGSSGFLGGIEAHLYAIVGALYVASLVSMVLLRRRQFLRGLVLAHVVADVLAATGLTPSSLELEVTEDILLLDEKKVLDTFQHIQELGVRIVFDDFGTGYASLSYLKKFPIDGLKIDRSFVLDLLADSDDAAIVSSTIALSKQLGLSVIAEGIENRATADLLATMGCEEGQGYFFSRPIPVTEFEEQFLVLPDKRTQMLVS